jgi:hypothetical protein
VVFHPLYPLSSTMSTGEKKGSMGKAKAAQVSSTSLRQLKLIFLPPLDEPTVDYEAKLCQTKSRSWLGERVGDSNDSPFAHMKPKSKSKTSMR